MPRVQLGKVSFAERYCNAHGLGCKEFTESVLLRSLYPQARILRPVLRLLPGYFKPDRDFIASVGELRSMRDYDREVFAYVNDPGNLGFLRRALKLRVSAARLNSVLWSTLRDGSSQPFEFGR
jgi:hypothetical protein